MEAHNKNALAFFVRKLENRQIGPRPISFFLQLAKVILMQRTQTEGNSPKGFFSSHHEFGGFFLFSSLHFPFFETLAFLQKIKKIQNSKILILTFKPV